MKRTALFAIAAAVALAVAAPAAAETIGVEHASQRIAYADLNMSGNAGAGVMLHRIRAAARDVCGYSYGVRPINERARVRACVRDTVEKTVAQMNNPLLAALYYGHTPSITVASR